MNRRDAPVSRGGTLLLGTALTTNAQSVKGARRMGWLGLGVLPDTDEARLEGRRVWAPARELGWVEGETLLVERRWTTDREKLRSFADELVRLNVELILTNGTEATLAAKSATSRIPIVFTSAFDPIRDRLVEDLAKTGGNVTGYSSVATAINMKRIEILRELLPSARRVGLLIYPPNRRVREEAARDCRSLDLEPVALEVASASNLENAVTEATRQRVNALLVYVGGTTSNEDVALMRAAIKHLLPTIVANKGWVELGGLVSLMADETEQYQRVAYYVDKILRGAKPSELPVQQPTKFVLSINLKTAKAIGITVPPPLLARADQVIE
jgi:putative ABC transport system substrate-binding protein